MPESAEPAQNLTPPKTVDGQEYERRVRQNRGGKPGSLFHLGPQTVDGARQDTHNWWLWRFETVRARHDAGVVALDGVFRAPFARYWLSGFWPISVMACGWPRFRCWLRS